MNEKESKFSREQRVGERQGVNHHNEFPKRGDTGDWEIKALESLYSRLESLEKNVFSGSHVDVLINTLSKFEKLYNALASLYFIILVGSLMLFYHSSSNIEIMPTLGIVLLLTILSFGILVLTIKSFKEINISKDKDKKSLLDSGE